MCEQDSLWKPLYQKQFGNKWQDKSWRENYINIYRIFNHPSEGEIVLSDLVWFHTSEQYNSLREQQEDYLQFIEVGLNEVLLDTNMILVIERQHNYYIQYLQAPVTCEKLFTLLQHHYDGCRGFHFRGLKIEQTESGEIYRPIFD